MNSEGLVALWVFDSALLGGLLLLSPRLRLGLDLNLHNTYLVVAPAHIFMAAWLIFTIALFALTWRSLR